MTLFENITALIIEDDEMSVTVLQKMLQQVGANSIALDVFSLDKELPGLEPVNVVFLDLEMPRTNGYAVLDVLRQDTRFRDVPIVAYTTHTSHLNDAKKAGFNGFLGKPLDSRAFPSQLEQILSGEPVWDIP